LNVVVVQNPLIFTVGAGVIQPLKKTEWWGAGVVICLEQGANLHMAQLMPLPLTVSCFSKILIGCTCLVPAHPGSPGQRLLNRFVFPVTNAVMSATVLSVD